MAEPKKSESEKDTKSQSEETQAEESKREGRKRETSEKDERSKREKRGKAGAIRQSATSVRRLRSVQPLSPSLRFTPGPMVFRSLPCGGPRCSRRS